MKSVYIASFFADKDRVKSRAKQLTDLGVKVTSRWFDENAPRTATINDFPDEYFRETAVFDIQDIVDADVVVLTVPTADECVNILTPGQAARGGRHFESGFQYGLMYAATQDGSGFKGKELIVLGKKENVFHFLDGTSITSTLPRVKVMESWDQVVEYLKGE